ncbi:MAG: BamA/TamA family outer membrane protein [Blastocatellia bacterium]
MFKSPHKTIKKTLSITGLALLTFAAVSPLCQAQTASVGNPEARQQLAQTIGNFPVTVPALGDSAAGDPSPQGGQATKSVTQLSGRTISRDRNAPRRQNLQAIKIIKHVNGLFGGFEQGAGFGFGVEVTTADKLPGVEIYARAMGSMRLYRQGEVGAIVGNETTRGQVWFNYLRRTRDNFFGIGPRTSDLLETNYSVEARSFNGVLSHKFKKNLEGGLYGRFSDTGSFDGEDDKDPLLSTLFTGNPAAANPTRYLPGLNTNVRLFQYGAYAELDLRNNERGLTQGGYIYGRFASIDGLDNGNAFSDYGWIETELDGRVYIPVLSRKTSVALRAYADLKEPKRGSQIPFYELSWLGGRSYLRGFQNYRFRANNFALFQGEFRQTVWPQEEDQGVDLIVFADGGQVWGDNRSKTNPFILANDRFRDENWRIGVGGGVQYRLNKSTAFRVDIGTTNEKTKVYFSLSRGF